MNSERFEKFLDIDVPGHHEFCPRHKDNNLCSPKTTLCLCKEIAKADRDACIEDMMDKIREEH